MSIVSRLIVLLVLLAPACSLHSSPPEVSQFATRVSADPVDDLLLCSDRNRLFGWLTGVRDQRGELVTIRYQDSVARVTVHDDNTFQWRHRFDEPTKVSVTIGSITRTIKINPGVAGEPVAFFVVDRNVYRPGHKLQFVAFLRKQDADGTFSPLPDREVEVQLVSQGKNTTAGKMKLVSDAFGRITGAYRFSSADTLDTYKLEIPGLSGSATVELAEFRKAKVRLQIESERIGRELKLEFQGLDFLEQPVVGSQITFTAKVFKNQTNAKKQALNADDFAYPPARNAQLAYEMASEDVRLLIDAGEFPGLAASATGSVQTAMLNGSVKIDASGLGEVTLPLEPEWTKGNHALFVEAVLLDHNGREQRASKMVSIGAQVTNCDLHLELQKREFAINEDIKLQIAPVGTDGAPVEAISQVLAMRLKPGTVSPGADYGYGYGMQYGYPIFHIQGMGMGLDLGSNLENRVGGWSLYPNMTSQSPTRDLATATVANGNTAELQLDEPGAYKFVCIAELPDGRKLRNEIGCIVREPDNLPSLVLKLDRTDLRSSEHLTGEVHCRIADAKALLTVRDAVGIRVHQPLQLAKGIKRFSIPLPSEIGYGCVVELECLEDQESILSDQAFIRVDPVDRTLKIDIETKEQYRPGEEIAFDINVNREEQMDLVVSVFDKSLLGVADNQAVDVRDFFLADTRAQSTIDRERLRRRLRGVTVMDLIERIERRIRDAPKVHSPSIRSHHQLREIVSHYRSSNTVFATDLVGLLQIAGIELATPPSWITYSWHRLVDPKVEATRPVTLLDVMEHEHESWSIRYRFMGGRIALSEYHPDYAATYALGGEMMGGMGYGMQARSAGFIPTANSSFSARGDAFHSRGLASGQSFISHIPVSPALPAKSFTDRAGQIRRNFSDSAFWDAALRTDKRGRATVTLKLPDSLTNWQVVVTAVSPRMHVGQSTASFRTFKPIMVWPMIPRSFTEGDRVRLYASVHNQTDVPQTTRVSLQVDTGEVLTPTTVTVRVPAMSHLPVYWEYQPTTAGFTQLLMTANSPGGQDASMKRLPVVPMAILQQVTASGLAKGSTTLTVPPEANLDQATFEITVVPSLLDDALQSLDYLVQYPYGCVEQTMSRFLPAIVVKQTLDRVGIVNHDLNERLPGVVEAGVKRLLELQQPDYGWGWQAGTDTHEMMTPYALYGLLCAEDAGYVIHNEHAVDRGMQRVRRFINQLQSDQQAMDRMYCLFVYSQRHQPTDKDWNFVEQQLTGNKITDYGLAMALQIAIRHQRDDLAKQCVQRLHESATNEGGLVHWTSAGFSRWGNDRFEITAAVLKAIVMHDPNDALIAPTLNFFASTKRGDRWNSTKDTAMIIDAICQFAATQDYQPGQRELSIGVNGKVQYKVSLETGQTNRILVPTKFIKRGVNSIQFIGNAGGALHRTVFRHYQRGDLEAAGNGIAVQRRFHLLDSTGQTIRELKSGDSVPIGAYVQSVVEVRREGTAAMRYVLVQNPKPATCEILPVEDGRFPQHSTPYALREDKTSGLFFHHEQTGTRIIDRCVLHAELAGTYNIPPAKVELLYETLTQGHSAGFVLKVAANE